MSRVQATAIFLVGALLVADVAQSRQVPAKRDDDTELTCTLDSFFLRVKSSTCNCECNGGPVNPTASTITAAATASPSATTARPAAGVSCRISTPASSYLQVDDFDRVDCFQDYGASEQSCVDRGCIWRASQNPDGSSTGAPWCFKPPTHFTNTACSVTDNVARFRLQKSTGTASYYSTPWKDVTFAIENVGNKVVRFKFYDALSSRYEVPVPLTRPTDGATNPEYEIRVFEHPSFSFQVVRRSTGAVLFDTYGSGLVLEDQYLQIRTKLATNRVYGFGENRRRTLRHQTNQGAIPMWAKDSPTTYENGNHYGYQPYYTVVENDGKAHGVLLRTSNRMDYQFDAKQKLTLKMNGGILDFYILLADNPEQLTGLYTSMVGRPFMPPYWGLGFQLSRWGYYSLPKLRQIIERNKAAGVPQDVQTLDIDYMRHRQNFVHDKEAFGGLDSYIDELKRNGIRTVIILDPAIHADAATKHPTDPPYLPHIRGLQQDVYIKWPKNLDAPNDVNVAVNRTMLGKVWPDGRTAFPDFFTDKARRWWIDEIRRNYQTLRFDGLWIDMNEPANFGTNMHGQHQWFCVGGDLPGDHSCVGLTCPQTSLENPPWRGRINKLSDNTLCMDLEQECRPGQMCKHYDVHNLYGWSQSEPTLEAARLATGKRSLVISRSTYPGVGQHVGHWLGDNSADWGDLRWSIIGMQEFNMFGIPYIGADICGFFNVPSEEMCARWMQLGAFYPYSRNHNGNHYPDQDPAQWPLVAEISRKVLEIRYRLLPYLYTLFHLAHTRGTTVVRPLHHEFLDDPVTYDINDQFLWGPGLLIAPVVHEGHRARDVYFPHAQWYEYSTGKKVAAKGETANVPMALDEIGIYLRGGHIFAAQKPALNTMLSRKNPFEFIVAVDPATGSAVGTTYWDDGESIDSFSSGKYIFGSLRFDTIDNQRSVFQLAVRSSGSGAFDGDSVQLSEVHIYGLPFVAKQATVDNGQSAVVSLANGITTVKFQSPLSQSVSVTIWRS